MNTHLNLLPQRYRRRRLIRQRLAFWCAIWGATAIVIAGLYWAERQQFNSRLVQQGAYESQYAPVQRMRGELSVIRKNIEKLRRQEAFSLSLSKDPPLLTLVGIISRAASNCGDNFYVQNLSLAPARAIRSRSSQSTSPRRQMQRVLTLTGTAPDHPTVLSFVDGLRKEKLFGRVELKSSTASTSPRGVSVRDYLVECVY